MIQSKWIFLVKLIENNYLLFNMNQTFSIVDNTNIVINTLSDFIVDLQYNSLDFMIIINKINTIDIN